MASLVADYGTSSDSEEDTASDNQALASKEKPSKSVNYLSGDFDKDSSSSEDEASSATASSKMKLPNPLTEHRLPNPLLAEKLPTPDFLKQQDQIKVAEASVFQNQYQAAEATKHSILEQHVKMTSTTIQKDSGDKRKICWNFRKGKCNFGRKCKYSHGMEIIAAAAEIYDESATETGDNSWVPGPDPDSLVEKKDDDESYMGQAKRKIRAGINDTLVPSKKAMKLIKKVRNEESPWTM